LTRIAKKHSVSVRKLARANKLTQDSLLQLGRKLIIPDENDGMDDPDRPKPASSVVKTGKKVAGGVLHEVQPGQCLWLIAQAYNVSGEKIIRANGLIADKPLAAGKEILVPGAREVVPVRSIGFAFQKVHFVSVWNNERASLRLLTRSGQVNPQSRRILSKLAGSKRRTKRTVLLHPRLIHMLERVAERYPGQTIEIISGYRPRQKGRAVSKHNQGRAIDFRVSGVSNKELYEFIKELPRTGAGYYPNSLFVHMDVRDRNTTWIDLSAPGQRPQYVKPGVGEPKPDIEPSPEAQTEAEADGVESAP
jgi:uncharacterized protein YcbK (DUF882 family)